MSGGERVMTEEQAYAELQKAFTNRSWPDVTPATMRGREWAGKYEAFIVVKSLDLVPEIEERERSVFCRSCLTQDGGGYYKLFRMYVGLEEDLLHNFPKLLHLSCSRCCFETRFPMHHDVAEVYKARLSPKEWQRIATRIDQLINELPKGVNATDLIMHAIEEVQHKTMGFRPYDLRMYDLRMDEFRRMSAQQQMQCVMPQSIGRSAFPSIADMIESQRQAVLAPPKPAKPDKKKK